MKRKIKVAVLYGGRSGEHEISLASAASVIQHLDRSRFDVVPIGIDKQGRWFLNELSQIYFPKEQRLLLKTSDSKTMAIPQTKHPEIDFDVVFPVMHGPYCEDGAIQGLLELAGIPYAGSSVLSSAIAMDKDVSKRLLRAAKIKVPDYCVIRDSITEAELAALPKKIAEQLFYPVFVKPAGLGSSVGTYKVDRAEELLDCITKAFRYDGKLLIEKAIVGREIELAVLQNAEYGQPPLISVPGEIKVGSQYDFYSYRAKYLDPLGAELLVPAPLSEEQIAKARYIAQCAFSALECEGMARIDLFLEQETGELVFNEVNTIPGFTEISMYPRLWAASGISYTQLLNLLIDLAFARHERKQSLVSDYAM